MNTEEIARIVGDQRAYFKTHATFDVDARRRALVGLRDAVRAHEADIAHALKTDLGKSHDEAYMCEIGTSLSEIRHQIAHVARWSRPRLRPCDLANAVSVCKTQTVPYGVTLIMAPWNYPFLLTLEPLAGALAAGNTVVIKPSAYAPASSAVLRQICEEAFDPRLVTVVEGGRAENEALLDEHWDKIFFTGSVPVGKLVMERASKNLTPVTLELGGKSPCIVDATANLKVAARRIAFGKWLNVGQTCVAPQRVFVHTSVLEPFTKLCVELGNTAKCGMADEDANTGALISGSAVRRMEEIVADAVSKGARVLCGGRRPEGKQGFYFLPTILTTLGLIFYDAWQLSAVTEEEGRARFFTKIFRTYSSVLFCCAAGIIWLCRPVMHVMKSNYYYAWHFVPFLTLASTCSCFNQFLNSAYVVNKKSTHSLWTMLAGAVSNCIMNYFFIKWWGPIGATVASFFGLGIVFVLRALDAHNMIGMSIHPGRVALNFGVLAGEALLLLAEPSLYGLWTGLLTAAIILFNFAGVWAMARMLLPKLLGRRGRALVSAVDNWIKK